MIGKTISHYKIVDKLGEGGMGSVWKAEDTNLGRLVAIKALSRQLAENEEARARFVREAQAASALNHANITTVYELLEDEGEQFIAMEYVEGKTIRDMVESGHVSIRKALDIIIQAAEALEAAHNKGILHRDIKSANIMVSMEGNVKVMDFGLAHLEERSQLTRTGTTMGTLAYSSPEQLTGAPVDRKSEVFSLGCVFYELLTGQLPFKSPSEGELVFEIINTEPDRPSKLRDDVPEKIDAVVARMLEKKPELRYGSCGELLTDLKAFRNELETTMVQISTALPFGLKRIWKRLAIGLGAAAIITVAALLLLKDSGGVEIDPNRIVITVFDNRTTDEALDTLGEFAANYLYSEINRSGLMMVVPWEHSFNASLVWKEKSGRGEISDPVQALAEETYAGIAVSGELYRLDDGDIRFRIRIRDVIQNKIIEDLPTISGSIEDFDELLENLRQQVLGALAVQCSADFQPFAREVSQSPSYDAVMAFNEGLRTYFGQTGLTGSDRRREAIPLFLMAFEKDSTFVRALVWAARAGSVLYQGGDIADYRTADSLIAIADVHRDRMTRFERVQLDIVASSNRGDLLAHYQTSREIAAQFPGTFWTFDAAQVACNAGHPREALDLLDSIDPLGTAMQAPTWWYQRRSYAHLAIGDFEGVLDDIQKAQTVSGTPDLYTEAEIMAMGALGRSADLLRWLENGGTDWTSFWLAAKRLKYHGHLAIFDEFVKRYEEYIESLPQETKDSQNWRRNRATLCVLLGRFEEAYQLSQGIENPGEHMIAIHGITAARTGRLEEAQLQIDRTEELYKAENYWLTAERMWIQAAIYAHLGDLDTALSLLEGSMKYGSGYWQLPLNTFYLYEPLWGDPGFTLLMSPEG